jgi:WD40 repeat protein
MAKNKEIINILPTFAVWYIIANTLQLELLIKLLRYESDTGRELMTLNYTMPVGVPVFSVNCVTYSPDGKYIVAGGSTGHSRYNNALIKVWDARNGQELRTIMSESNTGNYL